MIVGTAITKAYYEATGKTNLQVDTPKFSSLLVAADNAQQTWQEQPNVQWDSLYSVVDNGVLTSSAIYDLDDSINNVSKQEANPLKLVNSAGREAYFNYVPSDRLQYYAGPNLANNGAGVFTIRGRQLVFPASFLSTDYRLGWSIKIPCYLYVDTITAASQTIQVDDPMFMVFTMAATYTRNKQALDYRTGSLSQLAKQRLDSMIANQGSQLDEVPTIGVDNAFDVTYGGVGSSEAWL